MHYYVLSSGCYSDYSYIMLAHEKKFTKKEYAEMFNKANDEIKHDEYSDMTGKVIDYMVEKLGFFVISEEWEINTDWYYGEKQYVKKEDMEDEESICMDTYSVEN